MKKSIITSKQIEEYNNKGFLSPIDVLSSDEVCEIKKEIKLIEGKWPNEITELNRNNIHYCSKIFDHLVHNSKILDVIENFIGLDILAAGSVLFLKEPKSKGFISWHQDGKYQGWSSSNSITAWIAITNVNEENGCMRMWPGSHHNDYKDHKDTFDEDNLLTRGQTIADVPLKETVPVILKAGQLSLHHPMTVHSSGPNLSRDRRIGFAIQSYISTNVEQIYGKTYVQLARGKDEFNHHKHISRPTSLMDKRDLITRNLANQELQKILYNNSKKIGKY